jgi:hypothetical protein
MLYPLGACVLGALVVASAACSNGTGTSSESSHERSSETRHESPAVRSNRKGEANVGAPEARPEPAGPLCSSPAGPAVAAPVVAEAPATGRSGAAANRSVAVVILMLPNDKTNPDPAHDTEPRTYKLSLTANSETATIEVDGQQIGTAAVQRVYPEERDRRPARQMLARPTRREIPPTDPDARHARAGLMAAPSELSFAHPPPVLTPNGAPIID